MVGNYIDSNTLKKLEVLRENSVDNIIADISYELSSMSGGLWKECLRVIKPGGHLLVFGGNKIFHRIACAIEDGGFEIRDTIMWLYSSKTYLKPSFEPIIIARKPITCSVTDNVIEYGVGGFNIDECRVPAKEGEYDIRHYTKEDCFQNLKPKQSQYQVKPQPSGRFPANVLLTYSEENKEEVIGGFPDTKSQTSVFSNDRFKNWKEQDGCTRSIKGGTTEYGFNDEGSAARYFYNAEYTDKDLQGDRPMSLYQYLVRLISPSNSNIMYLGNRKSIMKAVEYENIDRNCNYKYTEVKI